MKYKPSRGAKRAAKRIVTTLAQIGKFEACKQDFDTSAEIIDSETKAQGMAEAIEKLLDYHRRNGAMNFQYDKWLDHVHNLAVALDNYKETK